LIFYLPCLLSQAEPSPVGGTLDTYRPYIFIAGIVVLTIVIMRSTIRRIQKSRARSQKSVKERVQDLTGTQEMYSSMGNLMAELAELSRQINGQIDTRCAKLEILLKQADQAIEKLQSLQGNLPISKADPEDTKRSKDSGEPPHRIFRESLSSSSEAKPVFSENPPASTPETAQVREVLNLSAKGMSPVSIAKVLNRPVGEIELILSLNGKKNPPK